MYTTKANGQRGSWFATVKGEELPCVHEHWLKRSNYDDPSARPGIKKFDDLYNAIKEKKRVVLTKDNYLGDHQFERTGYIAVFEVVGLEMDDNGLRFRMVRRLDELE